MAVNKAREDREARQAAGKVEGLSEGLIAATKNAVSRIATFHMPVSAPTASAKAPSLSVS